MNAAISAVETEKFASERAATCVAAEVEIAHEDAAQHTRPHTRQRNNLRSVRTASIIARPPALVCSMRRARPFFSRSSNHPFAPS